MKKMIAGAFALALVGGLAAPAVAADGLQAAYDKCVATKVPAHKTATGMTSGLSDADYAAAHNLCVTERTDLTAAKDEVKAGKEELAAAEKELATAKGALEVAEVTRKNTSFEAQDAEIARTKKALDEANKGTDLDAKKQADTDYQNALAAKVAAVKVEDAKVKAAKEVVETAAKKVAAAKEKIAKAEAKIGKGAPAAKKPAEKKDKPAVAAKDKAKGAMGLPKTGK